MTQDEIIRMARDADKDFAIALIPLEQITPFLERFAALVAAHEKKFWMAQIEVECNEAVLAEREAFKVYVNQVVVDREMAVHDAVLAEREACLACYSPDDTATDWADKIRARSTKE